MLQALKEGSLINFSKASENISSGIESLISRSSLLHALRTEWKLLFFEEISSARQSIKCFWIS